MTGTTLIIHHVFHRKDIAMRKRPRVAIAFALLCPGAAMGQDPCAMITDPYRRGHCYDGQIAKQKQWTMYNSWTPRQKQVSKYVSAFMEQWHDRYGTDPQPDRQGVATVMQAIGAQPDEFAFVQ